MGNADESFGPFPGGFSLEIDFAELRHHILGNGAGQGDDAAGIKNRSDAGTYRAVLGRHRGGETDKGFSALGMESPVSKIKLSPVPVMWRNPEDSEET